MINDTLNEREFELINIIGAELAANQRELSRRLNLSLGMTNILLKRLAAKGYIRIRQLNKRKVEYLLTPKGIAEKLKKSIRYTHKTIQSIGLVKNRLEDILTGLYAAGHRDFHLFGNADFCLLIEMVFQQERFADCRMKNIAQIPQEDVEGVLLVCEEGVPDSVCNGTNRINLLEAIAQRIHA